MSNLRTVWTRKGILEKKHINSRIRLRPMQMDEDLVAMLVLLSASHWPREKQQKCPRKVAVHRRWLFIHGERDECDPVSPIRKANAAWKQLPIHFMRPFAAGFKQRVFLGSGFDRRVGPKKNVDPDLFSGRGRTDFPVWRTKTTHST